ncbi:MAG: substrate-binding domain-containing protein [Paludibacteraceae bacterium]|nr:substrate-binding domain-containing protein [Paludibacteraceae bacterium]
MAARNGKIRIKDIAEMAGVSEGSVDRILHNRGNVSKKSEAKIRAVLDKINYKPNKYASVLASNKQWALACLIPETQDSPYWTQVEQGIRKAAEESNNLNVSVQCFHFNQFDESSFQTAIRELNTTGFDGLVYSPAFKAPAEAFARQLEAAQKPYALIDSDLPDHPATCYYGQHSLQSGYIAAKLLFPWLSGKGILLVHLKREGQEIQNQMAERRKGFMNFAAEQLQGTPIREVEITETNISPLEEALNETQPEACVVFNSKAHLVADLLQARGLSGKIRLIGYDTIPENVQHLKAGGIWCLIGQRPATQGFNAVKSLADLLVFQTRPSRTNYMPIDILTGDNIDYYSDLD